MTPATDADVLRSRRGDIAIDVVSDGSDAGPDIASPFAFCILWTPIQPITAFLPFVGHMGICDSRGLLHDWGGGDIEPTHPRNMMFGEPARYIRFRPADPRAWDSAVAHADEKYLEKIHCMICGSDCHSHVACALDNMRMWGCRCHNKVVLAAAVFFCGQHVGVRGFLCTWLGFAIFGALFLVPRVLSRE